MRRILCIFFLSFLCGVAYGQHALKGSLQSKDGEALIGATTVVLSQQDSIMKGFAISNGDGKFEIKSLKPGSYILQATFIGYANLEQKFQLDDSSPKQLDLGKLIMEEKSNLIDVVEVKAEHIPIQIKKDTIEYNADAFKTRPNAAVEDLLKRLPGVEVDKDGKVTAQGEEVQNVLVDGKEFFGKDPKMATKNLPADIIDKVQIYDQKSDMAEFTGIDDGNEEKTINLRIKDGKNKGYFGTVMAGAGTDERLEFKTNLNRFSKTTQMSVLGMWNNINDRGFSFNDYVQFMGGFQNLSRGSGGFRNSDVPLNFQDGDGLTETAAGGLNYNRDFGKKIDLQSSYFITKIDAFIEEQSSGQTLQGINSFNSSSNAVTSTQSLGHNVNARLKIDIDSSQSLRLTNRLRFSDAFGESLQDVNNFSEESGTESFSDLDFDNDQQNLNLNFNGVYRKRLNRRGRNVVVSSNFGIGKTDQEIALETLNQFGNSGTIDSTSLLRQDQFEDNKQQNYSAEISYTEPLSSKYYVELHVDQSNGQNENVLDFYDIDDLGNTSLNQDLSSFYNRDYTERNIGGNLRYSGEYFNGSWGVDYQHSSLIGDIINEQVEIKNSWNYFLPSFRLNYDIDESKGIRVSYRTRINEPSLNQLQPVQDNRNPQNIQVGNPELVPEYLHSLNVRFNMFDQFSFTSFFNNLRLSYRRNNIIDSTSVDEFFNTYRTPINADYSLNLSNSSYYSRPLNFMKAKMRLSTRLGYNRSQVYLTNRDEALINDRDQYNFRWSFRLENKFKEHFDLSAGIAHSITDTRYSISTRQNQRFDQFSYSGELILYLPDDWVLETDYSLTQFSQENFADNNHVQLWKAAISKSLMENSKLTFRLSVFDILNQNQGINRISNAEVIQESVTNVLGRYFMLSATYRLNSFKSEGKAPPFHRRRGGPR